MLCETSAQKTFEYLLNKTFICFLKRSVNFFGEANVNMASYKDGKAR